MRGLPPLEAAKLNAIVQEKARRQLESLGLWEGFGAQLEFHKATVTERVVRGGWRGGKSACCAVEAARAALARDPFGKFPSNRPITIWVVAWEEGNIGRTIYRLLFRAGTFQIIQDKTTGLWRSYRPWLKEDKEREGESKLAPPLIPQRFIKEIAWKDKGRKIFSRVELVNGSEIYAFSSGGDPPTGDPVDLVWIDEDLQYGEHFRELEARLSDRKGKLIWSAKPRSRNETLMKLCDRAKEQVGMPLPTVQEFVCAFSDNPHIESSVKRERIESWSTTERFAFDFGEFLTDDIIAFPGFSMDTHGVPQNCDPSGVAFEDQPWKLDVVLSKKQVPPDWCRLIVVDPGHTVCYVMFAAVPPPELGDYVVPYDELYLRNCTPPIFGEQVARKAAGQSFYAFIIDEHGSRVRTAVDARTIKQQYADQLRTRGVASEITGSNFIAGSDDVAGRNSIIRSWLSIREDGSTRLRILRGCCPELVKAVTRCRKRIINGFSTDEIANRDNHPVDCLGYLAAFNPTYHAPKEAERPMSTGYLAFLEFDKLLKHKRGPATINLCPGRN